MVFKKLYFCLIAVLLLLTIFSGNAQTNTRSGLPENSSTIVQGNIYAVVVGISDYAELKDLQFADRDATLFAQYLEKDLGVPKKHIKLFVNEEATRFNIVDEIYHLIDLLKPNDIVYFYFAGHGDIESKITEDNSLLLLYKSLTVSYLKGADFIFLSELRQWLDRLNKKEAKVVFIADACHSGGLIGGKEGQEKTATALVSEWKNQTKIVSCQANELSLEGKEWGEGRGLFSYHLVEGLQGMADTDDDKQVTLFELQSYLYTQVHKQAAPNSQTPIVSGNPNQTMSSVNAITITTLKAKKAKNYPVLATVNTKGIEDELLAATDSLTRYYYAQYKATLQRKAYSVPEKECAYYYLTQIRPNTTNEDLLRLMKRNFAAALQEKAMEIMLPLLEGKNVLTTAENCLLASKELQLAKEILGVGHFLNDALEARSIVMKVFYETWDMEINSTKFTELQLQKIKDVIDLLLASSRLEPNASYTYFQLGYLYKKLRDYKNTEKYYNLFLEFIPNHFETHFNLGLVYDALQEYSKAKESFQRVISINSKYSEAYTYLGIVYYHQKEYPKAIPSFQKAISLNPSDSKAYYNLGVIYCELKEYEKSIVCHQRALSINPSNSEALLNLGIVYYHLKEYTKAKDYYQKAILINPAFSEAFNYLGLVNYALKEYSNAIEHYQNAISLNLLNSEAYYNLGVVYFDIKDYTKAIEFFQKAISINLNYYEAYNFLGLVYHQLKKYSTAIPFYQKSISINQENADAYYNLGVTYYHLKEYSKAIMSFQKVIFINPSNPKTYFNLGFIYDDLKEFSKAITYFLKAISINPSNSKAYYNLGLVYYNSKEYVKAKESYQKALSINPEYSEAYHNLGLVFKDLKEFPKAIECYHKAISINPRDADFYNSLCVILRTEIKDFQKAIEVYQNGLAQIPENTDLLSGLAYSQLALQKYSEAENTFQKALKINPQDNRYYYNFVCLYSIQNQSDKALNWLEQALQKGFDNFEHIKTDTDLDNIRNLPQFKKLIEKYKK
jgi:protein O-mannosyl-transferase